MRRRRDTVREDPFRPPIRAPGANAGARGRTGPEVSPASSPDLAPLHSYGTAHRMSRMFRGVLGSRCQRSRGRVRRILWAERRRADADRAEGVGAVGVEGRMEVEQGRFLFSSSTCVSVSSRASSGQGVHLVLNFSCSEGGCLLWAAARTVFTLNMERNVMQTWVELDVG